MVMGSEGADRGRYHERSYRQWGPAFQGVQILRLISLLFCGKKPDAACSVRTTHASSGASGHYKIVTLRRSQSMHPRSSATPSDVAGSSRASFHSSYPRTISPARSCTISIRFSLSPNKRKTESALSHATSMDPSILFDPNNSWEGPARFAQVSAMLQARGYPTEAAVLPSTGTVSPGNLRMGDNIAVCGN